MTTAPTHSELRSHLVTALRTIERLEQRLAQSRDAAPGTGEPIAVVGAGCRLPGGAGNPQEFWELLRNGVDATAEFPSERADALPLYDADPDAPGKAYTIRGAFLDRVDRFEPEVFGISPREALGMDPQHRIALEVAWEALEHAGYAPDSLEGTKTGVFLGVSTTDYVRLRQQIGDINDVDAYQIVGEPSFLAGRISYTLGLRGPSKVVDTACSSSLVALHDACQALRLRECDTALVGGVNLLLAPYGFVLMSKFRALSADGRCKTFSADADGYVRGEGAAIVVVRRLSDALAAGDHILAVIRGTAVNHDGRSSGLTVPNPVAQQEVIRAALAQAGIAPQEVDYVEAHGTGTALGDPIEVRALNTVLGRDRDAARPLLVGSVKTNIGHLEPAAGVAGLLKLVLALQHAEVPPSLHFTREQANPNVDWDRLRVEVVSRLRSWPERGPARIGGLSSFGASGTNAHAVLAQAPAAPERAPSDRPYGLFLASARTEEALRELAGRYVRALRREPGLTFADVCYTSQVGRAAQACGLAVTASGVDELADLLQAHLDGHRNPLVTTGTRPLHKHRKVAWLLTGQGSQYAQMGRELLAEPAFAQAFGQAAAAVDPGLPRPLREVVWPADGELSPIDDTRYTQPALFALEYALARLMQSWGLQPSALAGHSVGEITAACLAGVFDLADAAKLVTARGRLMSALPAGGAMAAVRCDEARAAAVVSRYPQTVSIAAVNGPGQVVVSGDGADVAAVCHELAEQGVRSQNLSVSHAFHSPLMQPILGDLREVLAQIRFSAPAIPLVSNLTGRLWTDAEVGPDYWLRHVLGAVRFADGVSVLYDEGFRSFCELGPAPVLSALGAGCTNPDAVFVPTLRRGTEARRQVLQAVGTLSLRGARVDWDALHQGERLRRVPLPTTPWRGDSYWFRELGSDGSARTAAGAEPATHLTHPAQLTDVPIPGVRGRAHGAVPAYELDLGSDHWAGVARTDEAGNRFLAFGALADTTFAVAQDCLGGRFGCVEEAAFHAPLRLSPGRTVQITVAEADDGHALWEIRSASPAEESAGAPWRLHANGVLRRRIGSVSRLADRPGPPALRVQDYGHILHYEPGSLSSALTDALAQARHGDDGALVALAGPGGWVEVLDATVAAVSWAVRPPDLERPATAGRLRRVVGMACQAPGDVRYIRAAAQVLASGEILGTADFFAADGTHLGGAQELSIESAPFAVDRAAEWRDMTELLYDAVWERLEDSAMSAEPGADPVAGEGFLLVGDRSGFAERLALALRARGAQADVVQAPVAAGEQGWQVNLPVLRSILDAWCRRMRRPARVLLLTGLDTPAPDAAAASDIEEHMARGDLLAVSLVRELDRTAGAEQVRICLVTREAVPAGPVPPMGGALAQTLWGLGRVLALEHPERWGGSLDVDQSSDGEADAGRLIDALARVGTEDEQALRGADVYVSRLRPRGPMPAEPRRAPVVRPDGGYLITGGFGAIGLALARWLARAGAGRIVLLGRSPLPDRSAWDGVLPEAQRSRVQAVLELERLGVEVRTVAADVTDEPAMAAAVAEALDHRLPLRGVVHAAGVSLPQFVRDVDTPTYGGVWRPKVLGGWLLDRLTRPAELDFFLGFSSIAATWGSQHLASYAAGNAFLDGLAHHRRAAGRPALTVAWGPWELASNLFDQEVMDFLTATGLFPLAEGQCLRLLGALLADPERTHQVVCAADWNVYKPVMEARTDRPMLRAIVLTDGPDASAEADDLVKALLAEDQQARSGQLAEFLRECVAQAARIGSDALSPDEDLMDHGLDSLMVMEIVQQCRRRLGLSIKANRLFEQTTLQAWTKLVESEFLQVHQGAAGSEQAPAADAGAAHTAHAADAPGAADPAWIRERVTLDAGIRPARAPQEAATGFGDVLLTGATGFLGAHLLDELLRSTTARVHCLVRCSDERQGLRRIRENHRRYLSWPRKAAERIVVVPGDLEQPRFGLSQERFEALAGSLDAIIHNGAWVNFSYTYDQLIPANLTGTEEILRLSCAAERPPIPVHHVSTYGIWGIPERGLTVVGEDDDIAGAGRLATGYVQTKWAAERLVQLGRERGLPIDLYRPGRILGDSRTGAALTTHFTTRVIKGCVQLGLVPDLDLKIEMTPVDYVAKALVAIAGGTARHGANYHLINTRKMAFAELAEVLSARWPVRTVPVGQWWDALRAGYGEQENELHPVMDVVEQFVVGGEEAVDYGVANAEAALSETGVHCPPLDASLLATYLDWMTRTGYLPAPGPPNS